MSLNNIYVRWFEAGDLLEGGAAAKAWDKVVFDRRNKTTRAGEAAWRIEPARHDLRSGAVVARGAGAGHRRSRPGRWTRARTGSSSTCRRCHRSRWSPDKPSRARLRSTTSDERGTNVTWTLTVSDAAGREVARQALDLEKGYLP